MAAVATPVMSAPSVPPEKPIPKRLAQAFDALCVDDKVLSPSVSSSAKPKAHVSPAGVEEFGNDSTTKLSSSDATAASTTTTFELDPHLKLELSDALVNRVSFYGIIHDINKEATAMAQNDTLTVCPSQGEEHHPLVLAATDALGTESTVSVASNTTAAAAIDEEEWLLQTIAERAEPRTLKKCPDTFLQAMGEKEYDTTLSKSRTQLWKPSRSWWEAKSGKNPWIEPSSHNKRWRYLWPLIHYHKFLARCIKKLKRNNVDVKTSVSPVAVFLREEVCAVSDHLAAVSLFGSDEWMSCLENFEGWTDTSVEYEAELRQKVSSLKLRALGEPADVDSPLLRSQIDEHFLRAMANARTEATEASITAATPSAAPPRKKPIGIPRPPPGTPSSSVPKQVAGVRRNRGQHPQHYPPQHAHPSHWYGWEQQPYDNSSVHSGISMDSYNYPQDYSGMQQHQQQYMMQQQAAAAAHYYYGSDGSYGSGYEDSQAYGWVDPNVYAMQQQQYASNYAVQPTPEKECAQRDVSDSTDQSPASPYWSHLDRATISMGLATPAKVTPSTPPPRKSLQSDEEEKESYASKAQPLLLKQHHYYSYPYGGASGYPSPATQFLMTPQHQQMYYGASGAYAAASSTPHEPPAITPKKLDRESPSTVDTTTTETESLPDRRTS